MSPKILVDNPVKPPHTPKNLGDIVTHRRRKRTDSCLVRKKTVTRTLKNRAYYYRPLVSREKVAGDAIKELIDRIFCGSAESRVMSPIESRQTAPEKPAKHNRLTKLKEARDGDD